MQYRHLGWALGLALVLAAGIPVLAGSPHFVDLSYSISGSTVTVSGKEAGLGNETQVHIEVTVDASCINGGGHNPNAENKDSFSASGDVPVQNGKALFSLDVQMSFQPDCTPPMTLNVTRILVEDSAHGLSARLL